MDFTALKAALANRGYQRLSDTQRGEYVNGGYHELNEEELWDWRVSTATGAAPLTVADLGPIEEVVDTAQQNRSLEWCDRRTLRETYADLTLTGSPAFFYRDGTTVVRTFPASGTLSVRHFKVATDLSGGSDTPIVPSRYHRLIVDYAERLAARDTGNHDVADRVEGQIERRLVKVRATMLTVQIATQDTVLSLASDDWGSG